jgi:serine protease Do
VRERASALHTTGIVTPLLPRGALALLLSLALASCQSSSGTPTPTPSAAASSSAATSSTSPAGSGTGPSLAPPSGGLATAVRAVAQKVKPAVVQITNEQVSVDFAGNAETVPAGVGTGIIFDAQGHILTNDHVIAGAKSLRVTLTDGRSLSAKLTGADPMTDLAVVQVSAPGLAVAPLGDSTLLQVGDWVVAIGNALALPGGPTVTAGVVSALDRTQQEPADPTTGTAPFLFDLIQTDAAINPGNSGGPLVDLAGDVVGINTLIAAQAEPGVPAQGIGFAIAISAAKPIADQLVSQGHAVHAFLGIRYGFLTPATASRLGLPQDTHGQIVGQVVRGSPAEQAGLRVNDVITAVDNAKMTDESSLARAIAMHKPGDAITLTVLRASQTLTLKATLTSAPSP